MIKILRVGLFTVVLNSAVAMIFAAEVNAQDVLGRVLRTMDARNKNISSLKADLSMTKYDATLEIEDPPMIGNMSYLPKSKKTNNMLYARIDWTKPVEEQMSVIGDKYTLYRPRLKQVVEGTVKNAKGGSKAGSVLGLLTISRAEMKANYVVEYLDEKKVPSGELTWHLRLTPRASSSFRFAELWVDQDGMPRQVKITEKNNDTSRFLLTNIEPNKKIDAKIFTIKTAPGTKSVPG